MADVATCQVKGRLTKDPELRVSERGVAVGNISIAVDTGTKNRKETSYFDAIVFGKLAENVSMIGRKGSTCVVIGRLQQRRWEKDGRKGSKVEIVAEHVYVDSIPFENGEREVIGEKQENDIPF